MSDYNDYFGQDLSEADNGPSAEEIEQSAENVENYEAGALLSDAAAEDSAPDGGAEDAQGAEDAEKPSGDWSDASYIPAGDAGAMPRHYRCGEAPKREQETKPSRRGAKAAGIAAACLACAILGGTAVWAVPKISGSYADTPQEEFVNEVTASRGADTPVLNVVSPAVTPQIATGRASAGTGALSATDIYYDLAVNQTVAITTEITYTNVWGYRTTGAVKGSGFILSSDGYILTNYHVIEDAVQGGYDIEVLLYDGSKYNASVVGYAEDNDVAVLKIDASGLNAVSVGDSDALRVGESVYAVGNPLGELEFTMTSGMVSATDREITTSESGRGSTISMFQIDAAINSGNSGGPVYNSRGEVVGIATAKYADSGVEGLGFAIPINDAAAIAQDLITDGYVRGKAYMGITVDSNFNSSAAQYYGLVEGALVTGVTEGSSADKAGLKVSDIIVAVGDDAIASYEDLVNAKKDYHAGDTVTLRVYRGGEYLTLQLTFDEDVPTAAAEEETGEQEQEQEQPQAGQGRRRQDGGSGGFGSYGGGSGDSDGGTGTFYDYFYDFFGSNPFG